MDISAETNFAYLLFIVLLYKRKYKSFMIYIIYIHPPKKIRIIELYYNVI